MKSVAVIQARTSSSRLPGKVLLPIAGYPVSVLAAKRAANTGRPVILATSTLGSDDALAAIAEQSGLLCYRGSLDSPLERIVSSLASYPDDTVVFRLTADNVVPDGQLLDEMQEDFIERGLSYLCCNGVASGLPYGLSAEVFWLRDLRWALSVACDNFDHEHVTPILRRRYGEHYFTRYQSRSWGLGRCTIDSLDDYIFVQRLFAGIDDPVSVSWETLCEQLMADPATPQTKTPASALVLGTVQLGLDYGVNNHSGMPSTSEGAAIVRAAIEHGVQFVDTARAYGLSECVVGVALSSGWEGRAKVITKLAPLAQLGDAPSPFCVESAVRASVFESCQKLKTNRLDVVMLHRASHLRDFQGQVWSQLNRLRSEGVVSALGVSVQNPDELSLALECPEVMFVQMPFNLLDWRWTQWVPAIVAARKDRGVTVHVRSAMLQGLLLSTNLSSWQRSHVGDPGLIIDWLNASVTALSRDSLADLCLAYVRAKPWVDGVCVGMETLGQLHENIRLFENRPLSDAEVERLEGGRPVVDALTLNPASWRPLS